MRIRPATAADAGQIAAIANAIIAETTHTFTATHKTEGAVETAIAAADAFLVAEAEDGSVAGYASLGPFRPGDGYAKVREHSIYTRADLQGQGIGKSLLQALEAQAKSQGVRVMVAGISGENAAALAFHRKAGFEEVGRLPDVGHKFGRALDLVLMQKTL